MNDAESIAALKDRVMKAEELAEDRRKQIEWLAGELAKRVGIAIRDDGEEVCGDFPVEEREKMCPNCCAECWAIAAEVAVTPVDGCLTPRDGV